MKTKKGVNIGGWLVAERWMTPELFRGVKGQGERAIGLELGQQVAMSRMKHHRQTFITEADFQYIASLGLEVIRIPVGYWLFEYDEGYVSGTQELDNAFKWAYAYHLKVILDFHGLQGSQNGRDHSGESGKMRFFQRDNIERALGSLRIMLDRYSTRPALWAIEIINEPDILWHIRQYGEYCHRAHQLIRAYSRTLPVVVSDGFRPQSVNRMLNRLSLRDVILDVHLYQAFSFLDKRRSMKGHIKKARSGWRHHLSRLVSDRPVIVGEWSMALDIQPLHADHSYTPGDYFDAQLEAFDGLAAAWCYWSYKTNDVTSVWNFQENAARLDLKKGK